VDKVCLTVRVSPATSDANYSRGLPTRCCAMQATPPLCLGEPPGECIGRLQRANAESLHKPPGVARRVKSGEVVYDDQCTNRGLLS
jgi:hypothetical protein